MVGVAKYDLNGEMFDQREEIFLCATKFKSSLLVFSVSIISPSTFGMQSYLGLANMTSTLRNWHMNIPPKIGG
jgi:hypothetical protein